MTFAWKAGVSNGRKAGGTPGSPITMTVPGTVNAGDLMFLTYTTDSAPGDPGGQASILDPTGVTGWTRAASGQINLAGISALSWWKIAVLADASASLTVGYDTTTATIGDKAAATLDVYGGNSNTTPILVQAQNSSSSSSTSHVAPTVDTTSLGNSLIVSIFADREPTEGVSFTPSGGWNVRSTNLDTGGSTGGRAGTCTIDSNSTVTAGTGRGGGTITGTQAAAYSVNWTFAVAPAANAQTARPQVDVTMTSWTPSTTLGGGVQMSSLISDSSDSTWITSSAAPSAQVEEAKLPTMSGPPDTVTNRIAFSSSAVSGTIVTALIQGTTVIASRTDSFSSGGTPCPTSPTDLVLTLTGGQKAAITNLADLRIRSTVTAA